MQERAKVSEYLLELLRCGLHETTPREKPLDVSWRAVYAMAKRHSVVALAYSAIKRLPDAGMDEEETELWERATEFIKAKFVVQEYELSRLNELLIKKQIVHMPLKGSVIRGLYPEPAMREMCDLDILLQRERIDEICECLAEEGYARQPSASHHVELLKPPFIVFELHTDLMPSSSRYYDYYKNPWTRTVLRDSTLKDTSHYQMSVEDTYIFLIAHAAKHYYECGTGIRSVIDIYLYQRAFGSIMDVAYVRGELNILSLTEYECHLRELGEGWFSDVPTELSKETEEMQFYILSGATYGTRQVQDMNTLCRYQKSGRNKKFSKVAMYLHFVFLPRDEMQAKMYPVLRKWPILLPFCWLHRWCRILIKKPKSVIDNYRRVKNIRCFGDEESLRS